MCAFLAWIVGVYPCARPRIFVRPPDPDVVDA